MSLAAAGFVVASLEWYFGCGAVFAAVFLWKWVGVLDPSAREGTLGFRVLVFPGVAMLWPVFVVRLLAGVRTPPDEWTAHRIAARRLGRTRRVEVLR